MPIQLDVQIPNAPATGQECAQIGKKRRAMGQLGQYHYWRGIQFLFDAIKCKKPRPQAQRILLAWCEFKRAESLSSTPLHECKQLIDGMEHFLKTGMAVWFEDIDGPLKKSLEKAKTREKIKAISEKGVRAWTEFWEAFQVNELRMADGLPKKMFSEPWCVPAMENRLKYWQDQLLFISEKIAQENQAVMDRLGLKTTTSQGSDPTEIIIKIERK